uniref:IBB domain-containing protein n=1 Tax=Strigops habroptila TaxID=2489341 RepID=A0A672UF11_STRHB
MWGRRQRGPGPCGRGAEELRARRREQEAALRKARRQEQLVSKRLLREDTAAEEAGQDGAGIVPDPLLEDEVKNSSLPLVPSASPAPAQVLNIWRPLRCSLSQHQEEFGSIVFQVAAGCS